MEQRAGAEQRGATTLNGPSEEEGPNDHDPTGDAKTGDAKSVEPTKLLRIGAMHLNPPGLLSPEDVRHVVEENRDLFLYCYQEGLERSRFLMGRVAAKFDILPDGSIRGLEDGGSDFPDPQAVACVIGSFAGLEFPANDERMTVTVFLPLSFAMRPLPPKASAGPQH